MVLISNKSGATEVHFPKNINQYPESDDLEIYLKSELNHIGIAMNVEDTGDSTIEYVLNIYDIVKDLPDGEYTYYLSAGSFELGTGLIRIGDLKYSPKKNNSQAKTIVQYGE